MQKAPLSPPWEWVRARQLDTDHRADLTETGSAPPFAYTAGNLLAARKDIARLRDGIAARRRFRFKDLEQLRSLGIDPLHRYRVFEVDRMTDEILAVWCARDGVLGPPEWSEITRYLDWFAGLAELALRDHDSLRRFPSPRDWHLSMMDAGLWRFIDGA